MGRREMTTPTTDSGTWKAAAGRAGAAMGLSVRLARLAAVTTAGPYHAELVAAAERAAAFSDDFATWAEQPPDAEYRARVTGEWEDFFRRWRGVG